VIDALEFGRDTPLGAHWDGHGVNFALFSAHGEKVELCLFDADGTREITRMVLPGRTGDVWHGYLAGALPGLLYAYRVYGPYRPEQGHRFNSHKLLVDPYARAVNGPVRWNEANFAYRFGDPAGDATFDTRDSAPYIPKSVVVAPRAATRHSLPDTPWAETILYELHVKGMTYKHPDVPRERRGTFAGLSTPAVIAHLKRIGVTAVELMPIFAFADETPLAMRGRTNYWGYNPYAFFAVEPRYCVSDDDFDTLVTRYHDAGLEVILDVVFNHTAEGDGLGPTLSWRGIDNASYYWLDPDDRSHYVNYSGCGNTLNVLHPQTQRLILDSLGTWAALGVDGFRFDLAPILGHTAAGFTPDAPLFQAIAADPALARLKMIAEPWDLSGYHMGRYPPHWGEWNDRYRDSVRRFWRGDPGQLPELATRIAGSSDLLARPNASINFVASHDGRTLRDIVTYAEKHNAANGENNRDGNPDEIAWNGGVEGPTNDEVVSHFRERQQRNLIATLFLSLGVPMLLGGDEMGRTQAGNNNAYCQDNETSWIDWAAAAKYQGLLDFLRRVIAVRKTTPAFARDLFFKGNVDARDGSDIVWLSPEGREMTVADWHDPRNCCIGYWLPDHAHGILVVLNAAPHRMSFSLPAGKDWIAVLDTWSDTAIGPAANPYVLGAQSLVVFREAAT
jgi:isoamylase